MTAMKNKLPMAGCRLPIDFENETAGARSIPNSKIKNQNGRAFTLIELLVVITIIAILAAFTVPVLSAVKRRQYISHTQAELGQLTAAIDSYKAAYGFYPPGNGTNGMINQLYFELEGTTNNGTIYTTLDGSTQIKVTDVTAAFPSVAGFVNCNKPGASEDSQPARNFMSELKPNQTATDTNNFVGITILIASVGGPDSTYQPLGASGLNPWRYVSPGVNNPTSYDLWIQLVIGGRTNLVCNWSKEVQINNPLP
jgi:prepilin-type N-terminal cleavage/methylation domain-containing protein